MTEISKKFIAVIAAIVFATLMLSLGILAAVKIDELNDKIDNLNGRITQLDYNDSNNQWRINNLKNEIINLLNEQSKNYYDVSYKIADIDVSNSTATIEVYFSLKEAPLIDEKSTNNVDDTNTDGTSNIDDISNNSVDYGTVSSAVTVSYGSGSQYNQIAATRLASGKYKVVLQLDLHGSYEISYSAALSAIRTEKLFDINIFQQLHNRLGVDMGYYSSSGRGFGMSFYLTNTYLNDNNLKIVTAKLEIIKDKTLLKTVNVKDYAKYTEHGYENYGEKEFVIEGLTNEVFDNSVIETIMTVSDGYGLEYIFSI